MTNLPAGLALIALGLVALIGEIVLAGTGHLTTSLEATLTSIVTLGGGGAAGVTVAPHTHTDPAPADGETANLAAGATV